MSPLEKKGEGKRKNNHLKKKCRSAPWSKMMFEEDKQISISGVEKTFIDLPKIPPKLLAFLMVHYVGLLKLTASTWSQHVARYNI